MCVCVGGGKLSRCIRNKRAGKISESTAAMQCVCVCVGAHFSARVRQRKMGSVIKLSTSGICRGETHRESHLMCK